MQAHRLISALVIISACFGTVYADEPKDHASPSGSSINPPQVVVQMNHTGTVDAVAFSPNGKWLASGSADRTIKIWDIATGRMLRTLRCAERIGSVAFASGGRFVLSTIDEPGVKQAFLWDTTSGTQPRTLPGDVDVAALAASPNGTWLATADYGGMIKLRDVRTWEMKRTLVPRPRPSEVISMMRFSRDGRWLASVVGKEIQFWDLTSGKIEYILNRHADDGFTAPLNKTQIRTLEFSPDDHYLASATYDQKLEVWDLISRRQVKSFSSSIFCEVAFSPDGKLLAWSPPERHGETVSIWDVGAQATPRTIPRSIEGKLEGRVLAIAFEPHGHRLALGTDYGVELWDLSTDRKELHFLDALGKAEWSFSEIAVSGDAHWLAIGSGFRDSIWDLSIGQPVQYWGGGGMTFTPDSRSVAIASGYRDEDAKKPVSADHVLLSEVASGSVRRLEGGDGILKVAISRDGHRFAAANADHSITIWDATTGQMLRIIPADQNRLGMALSPNGRWLATATGGFMAPLTLWDVETGLPKQTLNEIREQGTNLAFSPDSRFVAFGDDRTVRLWNIEAQEQVLLPGKTIRRVNAECFSPDGRWLAAVGGDEVKLWDVSTLQEVRTFVGHTADVLAIEFCPDSSCLVTAGWDGTSRIWNRESGELLATLVLSLERRRWLVLTPDGLFDGSSDAWRQVLWRFDNDTFNVVPVEAFFNEFYHPGLLVDIMSGKRPKPTTSITMKDRRQPRIKLTLDASPTAANKSPSQPAVRIDVAETPADKSHTKGSGVRDLRLFRNGSLVKMWHGPITLDRNGQAVLSAQPIIVAGENELTAYAFNNDNIKSEDATLRLAGPESLARKGTAYILAVGINKYANSTFNLNYAVADADDFAQTVAAFQGSLASYGDIRIIPIIDAEATKANILSALTRLAGKTRGELRPDEPRAFEQIQATRPGDAVFIYYAGHGAAPEKGKRFYLIAHDYAGGAGAEAIAGTVNDRELEAAIEEIDASQIILVIDACQSGKTLESDDPRQGPMNSQGLAQLAYEKGMYILAAAQGDEAAKELSQFGHGLLTYALVEEGLRQARADDNPKDGKILVREWLDYATQRVPQLQIDGMKRMASLGRDISIVRGAKGRRVSPEDRETQRPRVFYRRDADWQPLVIAKP